MVDQIWLIYNGAKDAEYNVTDPSQNIFNFETGPIAPARFLNGVQVSAQIVSEPSAPFTAESLVLENNPVFLDQVVAGYPAEIQPATYTGTPGAQVAPSLTLDGADVVGDLSASNIYNVPAGTDGQSLVYGESASNNVVDGTDALILATASVSDTVIAPALPTVTASANLSVRTLTISVTSSTGAPSPTFELTALALDGGSVLGDQTGTGPWVYEVPDDGTERTVTSTVTATNGEGTETSSTNTTVPANSINYASYFAFGQQGLVYDISDTSSLGQNEDGTGAVTTDGDPVRYIADKSGNGNHATTANLADALTYRTDGTKHWLEGDGVSDKLTTVARRWLGSTGGWATAAFEFAQAEVDLFAVNILIADNGGAFRVGQLLRTKNNGFITTNVIAASVAEDIGPALSGDTPHVGTSVITDSTIEAFLDNASNGSTALTSLSTETAPMGILYSPQANSPSKGRIYGAFVRDEPPSPTEKAEIEQRMADISGATLA